MWPNHGKYVPNHNQQSPGPAWQSNVHQRRPPVIGPGPPAPPMPPNSLKRSYSERNPHVYNQAPSPRFGETGQPKYASTANGVPPQHMPRPSVPQSPGNQFTNTRMPAARSVPQQPYIQKTQSHSPAVARDHPWGSNGALNYPKTRVPNEIDRQTELFTNWATSSAREKLLYRRSFDQLHTEPARPPPKLVQTPPIRITTPALQSSPQSMPSAPFPGAIPSRLEPQNHAKEAQRTSNPLGQSAAYATPILDVSKPGISSVSLTPDRKIPTTEATTVNSNSSSISIAGPKVATIPLNKKEFQSYFTEKECDLYTDYFNDASICMTRANHISSLEQTKVFTTQIPLSQTSPFARMKTIKPTRTPYGESRRHPNERSFAHFVLGETHHMRTHDQLFAYPVYNFEAPTYEIPPYTHYVSSKRNALVEGDKNKTFLPYLGENTEEFDNDFQALEKRILENQEKGRALNESQEFASPWIAKIDACLAELGTSTGAVLKYLIDENIRKPPRELPAKELNLFEGREDWITDGFYEEEDDAEVIKGETNDQPLRPQKQWRIAVQNLPEPSGKSLAAAILACWSFMEVCGFSLWHVVRQTEVAMRACEEDRPDPDNLETSDDDPYVLHAYVDQACVICKTHQCSWHGEFSDDEDGHDVRLALTSNLDVEPIYEKAQQAQNTRDLASEVDLTSLFGRDSNGRLSGDQWTLLHEGESENMLGLPNTEYCSDKCFWDKSNRTDDASLSTPWSTKDESILDLLGPAWASNLRGACALSRLKLMNKTCVQIWCRLINMAPTEESGQAEQESLGHAHLNKHWKWWIEKSKTWKHDQREPFRPCNHVGKCKGNPNCSCYNQNISCEKSCNCPSLCSRRFRGCRCGAKNQACVASDNCDCRQLNRECDPDLCASCGAHEVLDPVNRYNDKITKGRCGNATIQRAVPKRTQIGQSKLLAGGGMSGWGLFAGEDIRVGEYIGEYIGEIVTPEESEQRGTIYNAMNLSYLFDLNSKQVLDSTPIGNKLRYINHQGDAFANCQAKVMFCGGVQRIGMFATKRIKLGEELLFNYGDGFANKIDMVKMVDQGDKGIAIRIEKAKKDAEASAKTSAHKKLPAQKPKPATHKKRKGKKKAKYLVDDEDLINDEEEMLIDEEELEEASTGAEDVDMDAEDDEDEEELEEVVVATEEEEEDFVPTTKPTKSKPGPAAAVKTKKTTPSDRMRKAWISRYRKLNMASKAKEQEKKFKKMHGTGRQL